MQKAKRGRAPFLPCSGRAFSRRRRAPARPLRPCGASTGNYQLTIWQSPDSQDIIQATTAAIPEPTSLMLGALGLAGLSLVRRRKA